MSGVEGVLRLALERYLGTGAVLSPGVFRPHSAVGADAF